MLAKELKKIITKTALLSTQENISEKIRKGQPICLTRRLDTPFL